MLIRYDITNTRLLWRLCWVHRRCYGAEICNTIENNSSTFSRDWDWV